MLSGLANRLFCVSSWVTVVSLVLVVAASSLTLDHTIDLGDSWGIKIGFFMVLVTSGISVLAQFTLWLCMMWFCLRYDKRSLATRALSVLVQFVGLSAASAIIYFAAYRTQFKRAST